MSACTVVHPKNYISHNARGGRRPTPDFGTDSDSSGLDTSPPLLMKITVPQRSPSGADAVVTRGSTPEWSQTRAALGRLGSGRLCSGQWTQVTVSGSLWVRRSRLMKQLTPYLVTARGASPAWTTCPRSARDPAPHPPQTLTKPTRWLTAIQHRCHRHRNHRSGTDSEGHLVRAWSRHTLPASGCSSDPDGVSTSRRGVRGPRPALSFGTLSFNDSAGFGHRGVVGTICDTSSAPINHTQ